MNKAIIACGSRYWTDVEAITKRLNHVAPDIVIHGDCNGADRIASRWRHDDPRMNHVSMPAQWETHNRSAGPHRNARMLEVLEALMRCGYDVSVEAFVMPGSKGTWDMIWRARKSPIETHVTRSRVQPDAGRRSWVDD